MLFPRNYGRSDKKFKHLSGLTVISFSRKLGEEVKVKFFWSGIDS